MTSLLFAFTLVTSTPAPPAVAQQQTPAADVLGAWDVNFNTQQGPVAGTLLLKKDGDKIVGTVASHMGESTVEASVKNGDVTVWFPFQGGNGPMAIVMNGAVSGEGGTAMKGTFTVDGSPGGDWTAVRGGKGSKDPKESKDPQESRNAKDSQERADVSGGWSVSVQTDAVTATPALNLKQDGEKLSGDYISQQYGTFPLTGTVKGSDVAFAVTLNIQGNVITGTFTGTLQPDGGMKGTVNFGDMMSGTFSAARKK